MKTEGKGSILCVFFNTVKQISITTQGSCQMGAENMKTEVKSQISGVFLHC